MFNFSKLAVCALILGAASAPAVAFTVPGSGITVDPMIWSNDVGVQMRRADGTSWAYSQFGGSYWSVGGVGDVFQVCADIFDDDDVAASYSVTTNLSALGTARGTQLTALFSNVYPDLQAKVDAYTVLTGGMVPVTGFEAEWVELASYSVSLQTLAWSIMEANAPVIDLDGAFGIILADSSPLAASLIGSWVANINSGAWTANPGVTVYHAASSDSSIQDRIWVEFTPGGVPEPATWAMLIAGFGMVGFAARRRESMAQA